MFIEFFACQIFYVSVHTSIRVSECDTMEEVKTFHPGEGPSLSLRATGERGKKITGGSYFWPGNGVMWGGQNLPNESASLESEVSSSSSISTSFSSPFPPSINCSFLCGLFPFTFYDANVRFRNRSAFVYFWWM